MTYNNEVIKMLLKDINHRKHCCSLKVDELTLKTDEAYKSYQSQLRAQIDAKDMLIATNNLQRLLKEFVKWESNDI